LPGRARSGKRKPRKPRKPGKPARKPVKLPRAPQTRRAADAALAQSEARFRSLTELSSDWYWEQDAELRFVSTAGRSSTRGGITATDHPGKRRWELPGTEIVGQTWEEHRKILAERKPFHDLLLRRKSPGGVDNYVMVSGEPFFDTRGTFAGYRGIAKDVTERRHSEEALAQSEARFRSIAEMGSDWLWETDAEDRYTWFGGAIERQVGRPAAAYLGRTRSEVAAAGGVDVTAEAWTSHMATIARREPFRDFRQRRVTPRGIVWLSVSGAPRFDAEGRFLGYRAAVTNVTAQVEGEQRAQESNKRLAAAIEHLNESVAVVDANDRIVVANRYFRELNGGTHLVEPGHKYEEHLRAGIPMGNYPEALGREEAWIQERLERHRRGGTIEVRRQDGKWLQVTDQRLPDGGMISFALDITERKKTELALLQSEHRFRDFASASAEWYWETDAAGRYTWISGSLAEISGQPIAGMIGTDRIATIMEGADPGSEPWAAYLSAIEQHKPFRDFRYPRNWPTGRHWVSTSAVPRFGAKGDFLGYRGIGSDVTESVEVAQRARMADDRLRAALENLGEMICLTDAEDRIVLANRRFVEFNAQVAGHLENGRRYDEHLRAGISIGLFPDAVGREEKWIAERVAMRRNPRGPVERRRQDGRWLMVDDQLLPDGSIITYGIEITARKQAEEALRNINADLERRVAERTAAMQSAYRELESFSYSVSHDLRSPLGVIASFAGILARQEAGRISEDGMRLVSVIDENAQRMGRLIDALLELMRTSRRALAHRPLDMNRIAGAVSRELQRDYPQARIDVGELPAAEGDEMLVQQVYANLVGNALKFSAKTAAPRVELGAEPGNGAPVYFVRDNGAGFDAEHAGKLFKPFERLHSEQEFPGTGIGLALVNLIVQRHGGRIWAESAPGRGSTFRFTLAQEGPGAPGTRGAG
jgi:PAS domain S-box-containing protein